MRIINCVGDSLTFGARDEFHRSYPAELSKIFFNKERKKVYCVNNGISGETSGQLLKRIYQNCFSFKRTNIGLLLIGSNDTQTHIPEGVFEDNLRQITMVMKSFYNNVGVALIPEISGPGLLVYPKESQKIVNQYNKIIKNLEEVFFVDLTKMKNKPIDTVHFNNKGYIEMAEIFYSSMKENGVKLW